MLVLTRRVGESLCIGDSIILRIIQIDRGKVRLGVDAPREVVVDRLEIRERKKADAVNAIEQHETRESKNGNVQVERPGIAG